MELWILITIAAAFFQNIRFMLQKMLKGQLSTLGVTFSRFVFGAPLALLTFLGVWGLSGQVWPGMTPAFVLYAIWGGIAQIVATALLVQLFSYRNFAVGVTFSKTETMMTVLLSALVLGEWVSGFAMLAILVTLAGVLVLSGLPSAQNWRSGIFSTPALIGLASGAIFSMASIGYRGAALALEEGDFLIRASLTLAFVTAFQAGVMAIWLRWREPGEVMRTLASWRVSRWVGLTSMLGSLGWFAAFTLMNAALVKAVGQIELVFTLAASVLFFREKISKAELAGIALVMAGIVMILLG